MNVLLSGLLDAYAAFWAAPMIADRVVLEEGLSLGVYLWERIYAAIKGGATSGPNSTQGTFDAHAALDKWMEATKKAAAAVSGLALPSSDKFFGNITRAEAMLAGLKGDCEMLGWFKDTRRQFIDKGNAAVTAVFENL